MLVKFSCKNHASVIMFGDVAQEIIKMMGHSGKVPSAIFSSDIPEVLVKLNSAIEREKIRNLNNVEVHENAEPTISIIERAYPLLELLKTAIEGKCDVMWETL
ncbi:TPA: DUF1840 domain-containing protein [Vibrio parahaemolyticus]|uniref:DUF1840 domain-containing protein n=1 Tax=Vibrio parahaemolyticus TaxID=670 RepID=UPI0008FC6EF0|nr:DUF1840 domain-containing protein [Vibrio parahaemolyticus]TOI47708.1 DUF1840 domain-containing protein [Vibrio parahaemolyticus]TOK03635.1 DUF1840 domain-containing protein [Vibrio parahaemolyticus]TOO77099.1 DUF1840 domain-containing protein [Vibrio parahaemolyticus]HAV1390396.1 DUF1840 domain-containing protein [Vibrio parahaemolyticus]